MSVAASRACAIIQTGIGLILITIIAPFPARYNSIAATRYGTGIGAMIGISSVPIITGFITGILRLQIVATNTITAASQLTIIRTSIDWIIISIIAFFNPNSKMSVTAASAAAFINTFIVVDLVAIITGFVTCLIGR
tara:strand:- start:107 stop:517 length:411 start_codon:yes stop_codon:yes gene_type:complete